MLGNWPKGMVQDRYEFFFDTYGEGPSEVDYLFEIKTPGSGMYDQRTSAIAMGALQQKTVENTSVTYRRPSEAFTAYCVYRDFDDGLELTRNEVERFPEEHVKDLVKTCINDWGRGVRLTEERFSATFFTKGGFTAGHDNFKNVIPNLISQNAGGLGYDGVEAFNRSNNLRSSKGGGTYYNAITGTLNIANYGTLYDLIFVTNAYNERDEEIDTKSMGEVYLLFPPQLRDEAVQTIESEYLPGSDYNDKNPRFKSSKLVEWSILRSNASTWYMGIAKHGIRFYRPQKPDIRMFRDEDSGSYKATIRTLYGWMFYNFRFVGGSNVPTS